jgi:hypothetical protein
VTNDHILIFWHWKASEVFPFDPLTVGSKYVVSLYLLLDKTSSVLISFWGVVLTHLLITLFVRFFLYFVLSIISFFDISLPLSFNFSNMLLDNYRISCREKFLPSTLISEGLYLKHAILKAWLTIDAEFPFWQDKHF